MSEALALRIICSDQAVYSGQVQSVTVTAVTGSLTILPDHAPIVILLASGNVTFFDGEQTRTVFVPGGVAEFSNNEMIILSHWSAETV